MAGLNLVAVAQSPSFTQARDVIALTPRIKPVFARALAAIVVRENAANGLVMDVETIDAVAVWLAFGLATSSMTGVPS